MTWSMSYRNDEQIQLLDETFNCRSMIEEEGDRSDVDRSRRKEEPGWFESFVFENSVPFGMNWFVSKAEIERMQTSFDHQEGDDGPAEQPTKLSRSHARQESLERQARDQNTAQLALFEKWWNRPQEVGPKPEPREPAVANLELAGEVPG